MWKVGELARQTGLTVRTLHHWEERGLIVPSRRTAAGHRLYDDRDVRRVYEVVALRELGLSLEAIAEVLAPGRDHLQGILSAHLAQVEARLSALRDLRSTLSALVAGLRGSTTPGSSDLTGLIDEVSKMTSETCPVHRNAHRTCRRALREARVGGSTARERAGRAFDTVEVARSRQGARSRPSCAPPFPMRPRPQTRPGGGRAG